MASLKSPELLEKICNEIIGGKSLRQICEPEGMPAPSTICLWLSQDDKFAERYARAKEIQMENLAEEILEIAEDGSNDWMKNKFGEDVIDNECVQRSRLRIDARKWLMSKLAPKKYGDKLDVQHAGSLTVELVHFADQDT